MADLPLNGIPAPSKPLPRTLCLSCGKEVPDTIQGIARSYCSIQCRFMSRIEKRDMGHSSPCWIWTGSLHGKGYGHFRIKGDIYKAHRVSYGLFVSSIPSGLMVCHACDVPSCVNPHHLFLGSGDDNMADRQAKQRQAKGETNAKALLTEDQVRHIRNCMTPSRDLSQSLGVSVCTINAIRRGETWRHLLPVDLKGSAK